MFIQIFIHFSDAKTRSGGPLAVPAADAAQVMALSGEQELRLPFQRIAERFLVHPGRIERFGAKRAAEGLAEPELGLRRERGIDRFLVVLLVHLDGRAQEDLALGARAALDAADGLLHHRAGFLQRGQAGARPQLVQVHQLVAREQGNEESGPAHIGIRILGPPAQGGLDLGIDRGADRIR